MSAPVSSLADSLCAALRAFDPASLSAAGCVELAGKLAATEKACAAARVRAAARVASSGAHRDAGFRDPADWLASVSGSSAGEAKAALATAAALDGCPRTRDAVVCGDLSLAQAREVVAAEAAAPGSEAELVGLAKRSSLAALRHEARRRRLAAVDVDDLHTRQRAARQLRHWRDDLGMVCGRFALAPEVGVPFVNRLDAETDRIRRRARRDGSCEERAAHAADAFAAIVAGSAGSDDGRPGGRHGAAIVAAGAVDSGVVERGAAGAGGGHGAGTGDGTAGTGDGTAGTGDGTAGTGDGRAGTPGSVGGTGGEPGAGIAGGRRRGPTRGRSADLVIVCDRRAWARGHAHPGEPCHIVGGTPIPVAVARELAADAFVKAVVHDGKKIDTVVHWGRHIPAEVRTALELGQPPGFDGAVCVEAGCGRRHGLEWDHVNPVANRGPTSYANLVARCWPHHHDKTDRDRAAGRLGRAGTGTGTGAEPP